MDEAARTSGPPVGEQTRADELRDEIEHTREELGETVEALAAKTDVKAQAKAKIEDVKHDAKAKVADVKDRAASAKGSTTTPEVKQRATAVGGQLKRTAAENPVTTKIAGAFLAGLLTGVLLKRR